MGPRRSIETISPNSAHAERLCDDLLESAADYFAGESFVKSDLAEVTQERTFTRNDDRQLHLAFKTVKLDVPADLEDDEYSALGYQLTITMESPYADGMYWPGMTDSPLAPGDAIVMDVHNAEEGQSGLIVDLSECSVAEIWDFSIDDADLEPSKSVRWEYYDDPEESDPVAVVEGHCEEALYKTTLGNNADEEIMLRAMDREITERFSTDDISIIVNALRQLGFSNNFTIEEIAEPKAS